VVNPIALSVRGAGWVRLTVSKLEEHADDAFLAVLCACSRQNECNQAGIAWQDRLLRRRRREGSSRHGRMRR
jgi:hypothetical protein